MNKFALLMAVTAYFVTGALISFYCDSQSALFLGLLAAGFTYFKLSGKQEDFLVQKRAYSLELAPLAESIAQAVTSGFYGDSQWSLHESSNMARGYLHFTISWNESWTAEALPKRSGFAFKTGHLEIKFDDITTEVGEPKTAALFLFQDNSAVDTSHFKHIVEKTMKRLDVFIKEHEPVQMTTEEVGGLAAQ